MKSFAEHVKLMFDFSMLPEGVTKDLCMAILGGRVDEGKEIIKKNPHHKWDTVFIVGGVECTYLILAAFMDHPGFIKPLVDAGAFIDYPDNYGQTPLFMACLKNKISAAKELLACGAFVNCRKRNGWTPVATAAVQGFTELTRILIEAGADVNVEFEGMMTPLAGARQFGHQEVVKMLLKAGAK